MDLGAYAQIDELDKIAQENGIVIPRLRGYRLMEHEDPIPLEEIKRIKKECEVEVAERLCCSEPFWSLNPEWTTWSNYTDRLRDYYLVRQKREDGFGKENVGIRWDRIHGKKRKILKYGIKLKQRKIQKQFDMWNKYAGQPGVLYIHSRMGGGNWTAYEDKDSITGQPWFLDRVDDWWDGTYCDFYARLS